MVQPNNLYKGSTKLSTMQIGDNIVKEVYKGTQLIYQSGPSGPYIKLYGLTCISSVGGADYPYNGYLVGDYSTSGFYADGSTLNDISAVTLTSVSGTLGTSGSKVGLNNNSPYYVFKKTITINDMKVYIYDATNYLTATIWIMENSPIGSCALMSSGVCNQPTSVNGDTVTISNVNLQPETVTGTRNSTIDKIWTLDGII